MVERPNRQDETTKRSVRSAKDSADQGMVYTYMGVDELFLVYRGHVLIISLPILGPMVTCR